jgi:hypothetical protein
LLLSSYPKPLSPKSTFLLFWLFCKRSSHIYTPDGKNLKNGPWS